MGKAGIPARRNPDAEAAVQYLTWALELIEKCGAPSAAHHARLALQELRRTLIEEVASTPNQFDHEAKRFRDKADEAEQLAELATKSSRRDAIMRIVETYRSISEQMQLLSKAGNGQQRPAG